MRNRLLLLILGLVIVGMAMGMSGGCGQNPASTLPFEEGTSLPSIKEVYLPHNIGGKVLLAPGQTISISVEVEDDDPSGYLVKWEVNGGTLSSLTGESVVYTAPSAWGTYSLSVWVMENPDGSGVGSGYSYGMVVSPWRYVKVDAPSYTYWSAFSAIDCDNNNNFWIAGWDSIYKYNGSSWVSQDVSFNGHLDCISSVSTRDVWAFGWYFGQTGIYCHYDGVNWSSGYFSPPPNGADFATSDDGWIVGNNGVIKHWNGSTWESSPSSTSNNLNSIVAKASMFVWAVGDNGTILRYLGAVWENFPSPTTERLNKIIFNRSNDGWIVGNKGAILHWNGTSWNSVESPTTADLISIAFRSSNEGWIIGRNRSGYTDVLLYYDGSSWKKLFEVPIFTISDVAFASQNSGWMIGNVFLKYEP